jgi:hypothetical protein
MKRIAVCASPILLVLIALSAQAQPAPDTPFADKAIRDAIASLKKKQASFKKPEEKAKLAKAIAVLELSLKPPAEPMKEKEKAKEAPKVVEDPAKVTRENYLKIKIGMKLDQVEAILGAARERFASENAFKERILMVWRSGPDRGATIIDLHFEVLPESDFKTLDGSRVPARYRTRVTDKRILD